jgi:hypothetical protein
LGDVSAPTTADHFGRDLLSLPRTGVLSMFFTDTPTLGIFPRKLPVDPHDHPLLLLA